MSLLSLSPELLLTIARHLRQVDLLNIGLVCKRLGAVMEPELYREYCNPRSRPLGPFLKRIISEQRLTRYVKKLNLRTWSTLEMLNPEFSELVPGFRTEHVSIAHFERTRPREPTNDDYEMYTAAAKATGLINDVIPYTAESYIVEKVRAMMSDGGYMDSEREWYDLIFGKETSFSDVSYDHRFCHILRAGIEDALVVLMVAMLPNVSDIFLRDMPNDTNMLAWQAPGHRFAKLRRLAAGGTGLSRYPIGFFNPVLTEGTLETFESFNGSSWRRDPEEIGVIESVPIVLRPRSQQLKKLELVQSRIQGSDLMCLVKACPQLTIFAYLGGDRDAGPSRLSPASVVRILQPLVSSLQELYLDIDAAEFDDEEGNNFIGSLAQFRNLKLLSMPAELWDGHVTDLDAWKQGRALEREDRLCYRLPQGLEVFICPLTEAESALPLIHVQDICHTHFETLPCLKEFWVGANESPYLDCFQRILKEEEQNLLTGQTKLRVSLGGTFRSAFDGVSLSRHLPDLRWFDTKYAIRKRKPTEFELACDKFRDRFEYTALNDEEISELVSRDPEMQVVLWKIEEGENEGFIYESAEEDSPIGASEL